eukprot:m.468454 g.468454  ORF g.468454 m.468454 type:complete len:418 (+) comp27497_c0_seq1:115-1368(+)
MSEDGLSMQVSRTSNQQTLVDDATHPAPSGAEAGPSPGSASATSSGCGGARVKRLRALAAKYNLVLFYLVAITIGLAWPTPGVHVGTRHGGVRPFTIGCIALIFLFMGLKLKQRDVHDAVRDWKGVLFGCASILVLTSVIGVMVVRGLVEAGAYPDSDDFSTGMKVFFAVPTTLNMGIVISEQAGGNGAISLVLTTSTNLIGVFTVPLMLGWLSNLDAEGLDAGKLIIRLMYSMLLPCIVGQSIRQLSPTTRRLVTRFKFEMKLVSNAALACLPWVSISKANDDGKLSGITAASVFAVIAYFLLIHGLLLLGNLLGARAVKCNPRCARSVVIMASQKSFPVAATIISFLPDSVGEESLMLIACILCQQTQLFSDSVFVAWWVLPADDDEVGADGGELVSVGVVAESDAKCELTSSTV